MKNTLFVIISDIHVKSIDADEINKRLLKLKNNVTSIQQTGNYCNTVFIIVGDIAYSGKSSEYESIESFFNDIAHLGSVILCPGNHDHNFTKNEFSDARSILLSNYNEDYSDDLIKNISLGMSEYYSFENKVSNIKPSTANRLAKQYRISNTNEKYNYAIESLNTAWCSCIHEKNGDIRFPTKHLIEPVKDDINIIFFHHPLVWFNAQDSKKIRNYVKDKFNILITGHEHQLDTFQTKTEKNNILFIESIPFFDKENYSENGFITFEICDTKVCLNDYIWKNETFVKNSEPRIEDISLIALDNIYRKEKYDLNISFVEKINNNLGAHFIHPEKDELKLDDVFIYLDIKKVFVNQKNETHKESSKNILEFSNNKIVLIGDEYLGKTLLLNRLFIDAFKKDLLPLLITSEDIAKSKNNYENLLTKKIEEQYNGLTLQDFLNLPEQKVLLLDDIDLIRLQKEISAKYQEKFETQFNKIIATVSKKFDIRIDKANGFNFKEYVEYDILPLGYKKRNEIITRWNALKEDCINNQDVYLKNNDKCNKIINTILGKSFIPSTPFFLMTILQSIDSNKTSDLSTSAYGYYYQYLITNSLNSVDINPDQLDEFFNYITQLAYFFYKNQNDEISYEKLSEFNDNFKEDYAISIDLDKRLTLLVKSKMIENINNEGTHYKFKYSYIFYFFFSKYLANTLSSSETKDIILQLINSLHTKLGSNVLMFLTHHTKDESILSSIVLRSKELFKLNEIDEINSELAFIKEIVEKYINIKYQPQDKLKIREIKAESKDIKSESVLKDTVDEHDEHDEHDELGMKSVDIEKKGDSTEIIDFKDFGITIKAVDILGQLARNYYGSLKSEQKKVILKEAISAPLRLLNFFMGLIESSHEQVIGLFTEQIEERLAENTSLPKEKIKKISEQILFALIVNVNRSIIHKISESISTKELQISIDEVCEEIGGNAGLIIKYATKLERGEYVPISELKKLYHKLEHSSIALVLMKLIIQNYLYMFNINHSDVQKICHIYHFDQLSVASSKNSVPILQLKEKK